MNRTLKIERDINLASLTTLGVGGEANYFAYAENERHISEAVAFVSEREMDLFVLGGGSNVLISDRGFGGLTVHIGLKGISRRNVSTGEAGAEGSVQITVQAGEDWDSFVAFCVQNNLAGIECLSGIPGYVGGTPVQNVGAYGQEVAETIVSVRCYDRKEKVYKDLTNLECGFSYRISIFNSTEKGRYIVLSVTFELQKGGRARVAYKDLIDDLGDREATLVAVRESVLKIRRSKSMVVDPRDPNSKSVGSFFKNPVVALEKLSGLRSSFPDIPAFPFGETAKVPSAWLIEKAGFQKGFILGGAGISTNHPLALINRGHATALEILELKALIQKGVKSKFGIMLQPEPDLIGV